MAALLRRRVGTLGATAIGLSAMLGAGVFYVWAPAAAAAGSWLLLGLAIAAVIAVLNAASTTRLAVAHPTAGGAYRYGRMELGETAGFAAGILFLAGKTASAALIARIAASYLWPDHAPELAAALILVFAGINATGIRNTVVVALVFAAVTVTTLVVVIVDGATGGNHVTVDGLDASPLGVLTAANAIFFAFAGYARIATLSEEVARPERTLPRAVVIAVGATLLLYGAVAIVLVTRVGPAVMAGSTDPLTELGSPALVPVVRAAAVLAALGSLAGVLAGLSRTALAMSRDAELPRPLARISDRTGSPVRAEIVVAVVAIAASATLPPALLVGISSCAVLGYYAIAHASSLRRGGSVGWRSIAIAGLAGCVVVSLSAPWLGTLAVVVILAVCLLARALVRRRTMRT